MKYSIYTEKPIRPEMLKMEKRKFDLTEKLDNGNKFTGFCIDDINQYLLDTFGIVAPDELFEDNSTISILLKLQSYIKSKVDNPDSYYLGYTLKRKLDNMASMMRQPAIFDWTFTVDWNSGNFGDSGSCYFPPGGYVECMHRNGVGAIRRYKDLFGRGNARAWMAVDQPSNGYITIYNRYGGGASCLYFADMLSIILSDLKIGEFSFNKLNYITYEGSAHVNGDAAVLVRKGLPEISSVVLSLTREDI